MEKQNFIVSNNTNNYRLDKLLSSLNTSYSRTYIQKTIKDGHVSINSNTVNDPSYLVKNLDIIEYNIPETKEVLQNLVATQIDFDIIYEDEDLIVINKPAGLTVHPGAGNINKTLVNALLFYTNNLSSIGGGERPGIVHRIDKDTTGLMIVAKNNIAHTSLSRQLNDYLLIRKYKALVWGMIKPSSGIIDFNIVRNPIDRKKMSVSKEHGRYAITNYQTDRVFLGGKISLLNCQLKTGRTHQIRVHLSYVGHSIVGDQIYGSNLRKIASLPKEIQGKFKQCTRQALHSYYMAFVHPRTGENMSFEIDLPQDMQMLIQAIE